MVLLLFHPYFSIHGATNIYRWGAHLLQNPQVECGPRLLCHAQVKIHAMETAFTAFKNIQHSKRLQNYRTNENAKTLHRPLLDSSASLQWSLYSDDSLASCFGGTSIWKATVLWCPIFASVLLIDYLLYFFCLAPCWKCLWAVAKNEERKHLAVEPK